MVKDLPKDNLKTQTELKNRQHKADAIDRDICLWLLHSDCYKQKHGLKLVQNS